MKARTAVEFISRVDHRAPRSFRCEASSGFIEHAYSCAQSILLRNLQAAVCKCSSRRCSRLHDRRGAGEPPAAFDYIVGLKYDRPVTIFDDQLIDERRNVPQGGEHSPDVNS